MSRIALLLGLLVTALPAWAADDTPLMIGHQAASDYLPVYVAQQRGIFMRHGIAARLQPVPNGGQIPAALISGSIQIGTLTTVLLLQAASQDLPIACIAGGSVLVPGVRVGAAVVRLDPGLRTARDFAGRTVGVSAVGSFLQVLFAQWLQNGGTDPDSVHYVETPFPQLGDLLRTRRVDAALLVEPFVTRALHLDPTNTALPYLDAFPRDTLVNAYCVERDWAAAHPQKIAAFRAALADAIEAIEADPEAARRDMAEWLKLPPDLVAALPIPAFDAQLEPSQIAAWSIMAQRQNLLDRPVDPAGVLVP